jgi:hypothetical protein
LAEPRGPDGIDERHGHLEAESARVAYHLEVAGQRQLIDFVGSRFYPRPLHAETHAVKAESRNEIEDRLVVTPQVVSGARTGVATECDRWRITGGGLANAIEPAFNRVPLKSHEESSASGHALSFARLITILVH